MALYNASFVHDLLPHRNDTEGPYEIPDGAFSDKRTLARAMREAGVLGAGESLRRFRVEGDKVVTFPGGKTIWQSVTLEPADNYVPNRPPMPPYREIGPLR